MTKQGNLMMRSNENRERLVAELNKAKSETRGKTPSKDKPFFDNLKRISLELRKMDHEDVVLRSGWKKIPLNTAGDHDRIIKHADIDLYLTDNNAFCAVHRPSVIKHFDKYPYSAIVGLEQRCIKRFWAGGVLPYDLLKH